MKKSLLLLVAIGLVSFGSVYGQHTCSFFVGGGPPFGASGNFTFTTTSQSGTTCNATVTVAGDASNNTSVAISNFTFNNVDMGASTLISPLTGSSVNWTIVGNTGVSCDQITIGIGSIGGTCANSTSPDLTAMVALPVELTYFNAIQENNQINLTWQTASEEFNEGFEVQRSANGENWEVIDFVAGAGTTVEVQDYEFIDTDAQPGINYYRLKQMDFDGEFEYSDVVSVKLGMGNSTVGIFPNPVKDELNLTGIAEGQVTIYNTLGQPLKVVQINNDFSQISMTDLPQGQYLLEVLSADGSRSVERVIKN